MEAAYTHCGPWVEEVMAYLEENVNLVRSRLKHIPGVSLIEPEGSFLLWIDFRGLGLQPEALTEFLRNKAGWSVTRGPAFGDEGIGFARLNIGCTYKKLEQALNQLSDAVKV